MAPQLEDRDIFEAITTWTTSASRTLQRSYLHKGNDGTPIERPQFDLMRVFTVDTSTAPTSSSGEHGLRASEGVAPIPPPPTPMLRRCSKRTIYASRGPSLVRMRRRHCSTPARSVVELCSCFCGLLQARSSIDGIFETLKQCARADRFSPTLRT